MAEPDNEDRAEVTSEQSDSSAAQNDGETPPQELEASETAAQETEASETDAQETAVQETAVPEASDPSGPVRRAPVRKAPIGRGRKKSGRAEEPNAAEPASDHDADESKADESRADESRADESKAEEPEAVGSRAEAGTAEQPTVEEPAAEGMDGGAPPSERSIGYRERRRARKAAQRRGRDRRVGEGAADGSPVRYRGANSSKARRIVLGVVCGVAILACVAASIVFAVGINRYDDKNALRAEYSDFADQMIVNLTSLNPDNVDGALKTLQDKTSGKAQQQMQDSMKQAVGLIKDEKITTKTTILSDAVTKAEPDEGTVIVVYGWQMNNPDPKEQTIVQTFRWRVQMTRINGDLKMTNFEWVT